MTSNDDYLLNLIAQYAKCTNRSLNSIKLDVGCPDMSSDQTSTESEKQLILKEGEDYEVVE